MQQSSARHSHDTTAPLTDVQLQPQPWQQIALASSAHFSSQSGPVQGLPGSQSSSAVKGIQHACLTEPAGHELSGRQSGPQHFLSASVSQLMGRSAWTSLMTQAPSSL